MKIKMQLPVYASATFEADIDIEGKDKDEIFNDFWSAAKKTGGICHHCSDHIETSFEINEIQVEDDVEVFEEEIQEIINNKS